VKLKLYIVTLLALIGMDAVWLGWIAPSFYRSQIGHLLAAEPNLPAAGLFYLLFAYGMLVFVVEPGVRGESLLQAAGRGALFGWVAYGTYDLTNLATLERWSPLMAAVDMVWGAGLCAVVTLAAVRAGKRRTGEQRPAA
jgi:uncharacterized membrane protein